MSKEQQDRVEQLLGYRVTRVGSAHDFSTGIQVQRLGEPDKKHGGERRVLSVNPGEPLHLAMFELLCTPQAEWPKESS